MMHHRQCRVGRQSTARSCVGSSEMIFIRPQTRSAMSNSRKSLRAKEASNKFDKDWKLKGWPAQVMDTDKEERLWSQYIKLDIKH